ncbi:basic phospholipase A2 RVV-VD-like [Saccoglossus kowalevskii]
MTTCTTNSSMIGWVDSYKGYGCFCGYGGEGTPIDATDECCEAHDSCYEKTNCRQIYKYIVMYEYDTKNCGTNEAEIVCKTADEYRDDYIASCKAALCLCDAEIAKCFANNLDSYNKNYRRYSQSHCSIGSGMLNSIAYNYISLLFLYIVTQYA